MPFHNTKYMPCLSSSQKTKVVFKLLKEGAKFWITLAKAKGATVYRLYPPI
jgi:hypothetical protein